MNRHDWMILVGLAMMLPIAILGAVILIIHNPHEVIIGEPKKMVPP